MDTLAVETAAEARRLPRFDTQALSAWVLSAALLLYLAFNGGGYAFSSYGQAGIVVWWVVVIGCAWGLLPVRNLSRAGLITVGCLGAFTAWTAIAVTWSISTGRSFQDLALVVGYFGFLVLGVAIHRERQQAMRHTSHAVAAAVVLVAALSLATRLWPSFIPSAHHLFENSNRLAWPLDYWNGLAVLTVLGIPLLLSIATSARRLSTQAAAAAAIPIIVLAGALTQSRGGLISAGVALLVWIALSPERVPKLATGAFVAAGSAVLVAGGFHRHAIRQALTGPVEHHQAGTLLVAIILVCAGVAVAQLGIGLLIRHATPPEAISPPRRTAGILTAAGVVVLVVVALVVGVPHKIDHLWTDFKNPVNASQSATHLAATSGEGRYQYWVAGISSAKHHVLTGSGPGTFQQDWLPRAPIHSYVVNAHNLYVETYAELGLVGLVLLGAFIVAALGAGVWAVARSQDRDRTYAAGITAAITAFFVSAIFDWMWQLPVLTGAVMLLIAAALAPPRPRGLADPPPAPTRARLRRATGVVATLLGLAALVAIAYPLSVSNDIANSQAAVDANNPQTALKDAADAVRAEPDSGEAQIQYALVLEYDHQIPAAVAAAQHAAHSEPDNWTNWLTLSRLEAEHGDAKASVAAYKKAKSLNPSSSLFKS